MRTSSPTPDGVKVWDPFVRIFHWSLVACVLTNYFVIDDGEDWHQWIGYAASALVTLRIVWGSSARAMRASPTSFRPRPVCEPIWQRCGRGPRSSTPATTPSGR